MKQTEEFLKAEKMRRKLIGDYEKVLKNGNDFKIGMVREEARFWGVDLREQKLKESL